MCQLLGMNCNAPTDVTFSFRGFAQRGGQTDHHADGWGIAFFEGDAGGEDDKGLRHFVDHQPACSSPVAELISRYPIKSRNVIAHIRKATQGRVALENCHPFVRELWGRYWVFAHNGDLQDFQPRLHGTFNFLLSNGQALWAHASTKSDSQGLYYIERQHPFAHATLSDEDVSVDFAEHTNASDRVAVVVSAPLTTNEHWTAFAPGELKVFECGVSAPS
jgi:glutamine amidotransferase